MRTLLLAVLLSVLVSGTAKAQIDYSFDHWLEVRDRLAETLVLKQGMTIDVARAELKPTGGFTLLELMGANRRTILMKRYNMDKVKAAKSGISFDSVLTKRFERAIL